MATRPSHLTQAIIEELSGLAEDVSDDISKRSRARRVIVDLANALSEGSFDSAARILGNRSEQLIAVYPRTKSTLDKLQLDLNRRLEAHLRETGRELENYCRTQGIPLAGKAPKYTVGHLLDVEFDRAKLRSKVGIQSLTTFEWTAVRNALEQERARLWQRPFDAITFRDRLLDAYRALAAQGAGPTGWVGLEDIYQMLKGQEEDADPAWQTGGRLVAYYKDEFSADLSRLWEAQVRQKINAPHIELSAIRDPRRAFRVIQPDRNVATYGFLRPRES